MITRLTQTNEDLSKRIEVINEDKMQLIDNLRDKDNELRIIKDDMSMLTARLQAASIKLCE